MKRRINMMLEEIRHHSFPVYAIILFGSTLTQRLNERSDLDICVVYDNEPSMSQKRELENFFYNVLDDEVRVDFIYCSRQRFREGTHVFESIRREGRVIWQHTGK